MKLTMYNTSFRSSERIKTIYLILLYSMNCCIFSNFTGGNLTICTGLWSPINNKLKGAQEGIK